MRKYRKILWIAAPFLIWYIFCLPRNLFDSPLSATLSASDGTLLGARISADEQWRFAPADSVPEKFAECIIAYEDKRFRLHPGFDPLSALRALGQNIRGGRTVSGASTLTMQVVRLSRPDAPRNLAEKLYEILLSSRLELRCTKDEILLLYASNAPFGGNVVGIEAASWRYFGRSAGELSWAESAMLAVLPNSPGAIHPGRGREALLRKRNFLLDKLVERGIIDEVEGALAKDEPLPERPVAMPDEAYHLLERCRREGGDRAYRSTLDYALQRRLGEIAKRRFELYRTNLVDNMGILVTDVNTGEIIGYYGNTRGCAPHLRGADVDMVPARRSSGSTLKPLLYAAMLQEGSILPGTLIRDTPYNRNNFSPHNYSRQFDGAVPAHEVIERSLNVPSVRMLEAYGIDRFLGILGGMGFDSIDRDADHYGLSLVLGGAEITLQNLSEAYYRMAANLRGGSPRAELAYLADTPCKILQASEIPLGRAACYLTFEALAKSSRPEEEASWMEFSSARKIAWKTGTSWGNRDAWCVGVTGDYVVAVWVGNSDGEGRAQMTGVSYAAPVMFDVFNYLPASAWFDMPVEDMTRVEVCRESGNPAGELCPQRDTIWAPDVPERPETCRYHILVHLDPEGIWQVNSNCCPPSQMRSEVRFVLPPAQEWYYMKKHLDYRQLPPKHPDWDAGSQEQSPIEIIYPQSGITIVVTRGLDGSRRGAVFRAAHASEGAEIWWHLDDEILGKTSGVHEMMVAPEPGRHLLTLVDGDGASASVVFNSR